MWTVLNTGAFTESAWNNFIYSTLGYKSFHAASQDYTAPMPVRGGCPALEAITGAALAPMAVAGGVSILAYRER